MVLIAESIIRGFFPDACFACNRVLSWPDGSSDALKKDSLSAFLCPECFAKLKFVSGSLCSLCGRSLPYSEEDHLCGLCLKKSSFYKLARAACLYEGILKKMIYDFKYASGSELALPMAKLMGRAFLDFKMSKPDLIMAVPMIRKRMRKRGYNQALLLARAFACIMKMETALEENKNFMRLHHRKSQTSLALKERSLNVKNAFLMKGSLSGLNILLIDDVFTTGSTVNACSKALLDAGALSVEVLCLARGV